MMNFFKPIVLVTVLFSSSALALDNLELMIRTSYPKDIKKVGDAIQYIVEPFGYTVIKNSRFSPSSASIANKPLIPLAREIRTMPVYDAIQVLIGPENTILVDHQNKLISFEAGDNNEN